MQGSGMDHQQWLFSTGIEHQPGPGCGKIAAALALIARYSNIYQAHADYIMGYTTIHKDIQIEVANITHAGNHVLDLCRRTCDAMLVQEHTLTPKDIGKVRGILKAKRWKSIFGSLDPQSKTALGGVGALAKQPRSFIRVKALSTDFQDAVKTGRCDLFALDCGGRTTALFFNIYGYTGGHQKPKVARRTAMLIRAIITEIQEQPLGPIFICGDLNCDPADIRILQDMLDDKTFTDLGAVAHIWGKPKNEHTCITPNSKTPTRRDFIFANEWGLPMVSDFNVLHQTIFPVHSVLQMSLRYHDVPRTIKTATPPLSFSKTFEDKFQKANPNLDDKEVRAN